MNDLMNSGRALIALLICAAAVHADAPVVEVMMNPSVSKVTDAPNVTHIRFEDYVSNPRPNRVDPEQGWVRQFDPPFRGLVEPTAEHSSRSPLPPPVGMLLETSVSKVGFYDNTNIAAVSDVRGPVSVRFVNPKKTGCAAAVSHLRFTVGGTAVEAKNVHMTLVGIDGEELYAGVIPPGTDEREYITNVECVARAGGRPVSAIHHVRLEIDGSSGYFVLGSSMDVDQPDLSFAGFKVSESNVVRGPGDALPQAHSEQWARRDEAVVVTDLTHVTPASALNDRHEKGKWKVVDYETAEYSGNAIVVARESFAEPVTLDVDRQGWHAVYVGLGTVANLVHVQSNRVHVKLSSASNYVRLSNHQSLGPVRRDVIEEVFFTAADLTDESIEFAFSPKEPSVIAYVKMIPLTDEEVRAIEEERARTDTRRLVATFDGHTWIHPYHPLTRQDLANTFTAFEHSDVGTWWFQIGGADLVHYPTKVGTLLGENTKVPPREVDKRYDEYLHHLLDAGIHPLKLAVEEAHKQDTEILVMLRAGGWKGAMPWEELFSSDFYEENPQWRCVDYDGTPTMYLSYAAEEVQDHLLDVLREALATGADGAGILFNRGLPMILWEEPFCERFEARHGEDPRQLPEDDPRVPEMRAEIVTQFITKMRAVLDEVQSERGQVERLKLAVGTLANRVDNQNFGFDVERWIEDKLVDQIGIAWFAYHTTGLRTREAGQDVAYYAALTEGTDVQVFPFVVGWKLTSPGDMLRLASSFYSDGADGIAIWDPQPEKAWQETASGYWPLVSRLGHVEEIQSGALVDYTPIVTPFTRLGDNHYSRWFPNNGF